MSSDLKYLDSLQGSGIRPGLSRMRALLHAMGNPQRRVSSILVAGTNGKGSTAATLASILESAGYRTGLYTSPHLVELRERWRINSEMVSRATLDLAIVELRAASRTAKIVPTYFEALTLLAFLIFRAETCDVAVLEVGMGGRLDATNVVRPLASLVTAVDFDHMEFLGRTIPAIAREKGGIIHRGAIALTSNRDAIVLDTLERRSRRAGVHLVRVLDDSRVGRARVGASDVRFHLSTPHDSYSLVSPLVGEHQIANITLAVRAAEELRARFPHIDSDAIERGVANTKWRGRLERFVVGGKEIFVDGGHNPHAIRRVVKFVEKHLARPRALVFGVMRDKPVDEMITLLFPQFDRIIATEPPDPSRALPARELATLASALGLEVEIRKRAREAIRRAIDAGVHSVLVCGSLYLAGDAIAMLDRITDGAREERSRSAPPSRRPTRSR